MYNHVLPFQPCVNGGAVMCPTLWLLDPSHRVHPGQLLDFLYKLVDLGEKQLTVIPYGLSCFVRTLIVCAIALFILQYKSA